ncbi:alpha/beta hydrolase [Kaarinaea lacus]
MENNRLTTKTRHALFYSLLYIAITSFSSVLHADETIGLTTRGDVTQRILWMPREGAQASVLLFPGGGGRIQITDQGDIEREGNFLVRTRDLFAGHKLNVAVLDAPSDYYTEKGMKTDLFRSSAKHAEDIAAVVSYIKKQAAVPVWLVGTSRGTESAANGAIRLAGQVDGLVLTSSMTEENRKGISLPEMQLGEIKVPTLIVHHQNDECRFTTPDGARVIKDAMTSASKVELKYFSGGDKPKSKPCKAKSAHGYLGIEKEVVKYIADFIKSNSQ